MGQFIQDPRQFVDLLVIIQGDVRLVHEGIQEAMDLLAPILQEAGVQDIIFQEIPADVMQQGHLDIKEQQDLGLHGDPDDGHHDGGEEAGDQQEAHPGQPGQQQVPHPGQPEQQDPPAQQPPPRRATDRCQYNRMHGEGTEHVMRTCGFARVTRSRTRQ